MMMSHQHASMEGGVTLYCSVLMFTLILPVHMVMYSGSYYSSQAQTHYWPLTEPAFECDKKSYFILFYSC